MRVLHLTPELPYQPGGGGGPTREHFLCRRLVDLGHEVLNISPALPREVPLADSLRVHGIQTWVAPRPERPLEEVARAVSAEPSILAAAVPRPVRALEMRVFWAGMRPLVERALREFRPDVAIIGHDMAAAWVEDLPADLPALLTCHNLTWRWYASRVRQTSGLHAALLRAEGARYRRHVLRLLPRYDTAVMVSTLEAEELEQLGLTRVRLITTGCDTQVLTPAPPPPPGPPRLLFTGSMNYAPNHEGIAWFTSEVWPLVRAQRPDALLDVVGKDPPASVQALDGADGVTVHGFVDSMVPYFAAADIVVVPILTGAGMRVKIVEGMASGKAMVSTSLGCEGLPGLVEGEHLLVADAPQDFAKETLRVLGDPALRDRLAASARDLAEREYDWRGLGDRLEALLREAVSR